jgi:hypothetical protein
MLRLSFFQRWHRKVRSYALIQRRGLLATSIGVLGCCGALMVKQGQSFPQQQSHTVQKQQVQPGLRESLGMVQLLDMLALAMLPRLQACVSRSKLHQLSCLHMQARLRLHPTLYGVSQFHY